MDFSLAPGLGGSHPACPSNQHVSGITGEEDGRGRALEAVRAGGDASAIEEVGLRHLKTPAEIEQILHLREAIDLSVHSAATADFHLLEKKETNADSSVHSNFGAR